MHFSSAELFLIDNLTDGGFDERRAGEIEAAALRHQDFVAKDWKVRATSHAIPHDRTEPRNPGGRNHGVISKDPAEVVFVGKNFILHRQKDAGRIDQINYRK